jgi:toxin ParE1/3/4
LDFILDDLSQKNRDVADRYTVEIAEKGELLARFPEIGRARPEIAPNLRSTLVYPYVLFYRIEADEVQILRILHGKQDLSRVMREELGD